MAPVTLYQVVLPLSPAKAYPLLLAWEVKAYTTSERPCGPGLLVDPSAVFSSTEAALSVRMASGTARR